MLCNAEMKKISEIRRANLQIAIKRAGNAAKLATLAGASAAYFSQIKTGALESKTKKPKTMGDDVAERIEVAINVPAGWMDVEHTSEEKAANDHPIEQETYDLAQLITLWHQADAEGKQLILDLARNAADPDERSNINIGRN